LAEKNKVTRGTNCAIGRLGQYVVGDPDARERLDAKLKSVTTRTTPSTARNTGLMFHNTGNSLDYSNFVKRSEAGRKIGTLQPISEPIELLNSDVAYQGKSAKYGALGFKTDNLNVRRSSQACVPSTLMPLTGGVTAHQRMPSSTTKSQVSNASQFRKRLLQIQG